MHPEIAAFAERAQLRAHQTAELEALFEQHAGNSSVLSTLLDDFSSVDIEGPLEIEPVSAEQTGPGVRQSAIPQAVGAWIAGRYQDLGPIGMGGMGEVRRVRDMDLNRTLAMKILHAPLLARPAALARFLEEAQATAQLQHPNIVPVHDIGRLPDGRVWFTMKEVRGRTLGDVTAEVHGASDWRWNPSRNGWTFKRVVASFLQICHAMAYAHERGVVHRDLKPDNVMVGDHGEVYVLDWGLAKILGRTALPDDAEPTEEAPLTRGPHAHHTRMGTVAGTPAYMPPEQAQGQVDRIDGRSDVYALGAVLYEILSGRSPYTGRDAREVLDRVRAGPPPPVGPHRSQSTFGFGLETPAAAQQGPPLPADLVAACERAMERDPEARYPSARALATEIEAWLDGARRREQALEITARALEAESHAADLLAKAAALQAEGDAALASLEPWRSEADKSPGWARQDRASELRREAELARLAVDQGLHGALRVAPDLPEAHVALLDRLLLRHAAAEAARDEDGEARARTLIESHAQALPESHEARQRAATWLKGDGRLTLVTEPAGAQVVLHRMVLRGRRLVTEPVGPLGRTPVVDRKVALGSYLCVVEHPDCEPVRVHVEVPRLGRWDGIAPGESEPQPIRLLPRGSLGPDEVYVPAGWFRAGGDPDAPNGQPGRRLWCDGFVAHRFAVTNRRYMDFLDDLVARGRAEEALVHAPSLRLASGDRGDPLYAFDGKRFTIAPDAEGDVWSPDWPVIHIDLAGARAWLAWHAERTGRPWRLPHELEWEKAARGVDGRRYPWGDWHDPSWSHVNLSHRADRSLANVDTYPVDCSPYGLRGAGGNVEEMCASRFDDPPPPDGARVLPVPDLDFPPRSSMVVRGGSWGFPPEHARAARRQRREPAVRVSNLSFRGVWSV